MTEAPSRPSSTPPAPGGVGEGAGEDPIGAISTEEIEAELTRREQELARLRGQRHALQIQKIQLDRIIGELERDLHGDNHTSAAPRGTGTPINDLPLARAIAQLYAIGDEFSPREAVEQLTSAGYRTDAKTFGSMVSGCLARERRFKRVGRGRYLRIS